MEAAEAWAAQYPELDILAEALRGLQGGLRALGAPAPELRVAEVRAAVRAELKDFREIVEGVAPEAETLRPELADTPLTGLAALHSHLEAELRRSPGVARAVGGEAVCDALQEVIDSAREGAPPAMNRDLEVWVQRFLREPLEELQEHERQATRLLVAPTTSAQQSLIKEIGDLSAKICCKGFNPDRVKLMDTRSSRVQRLLASMGERCGAGAPDATAGRLAALLGERLKAFEAAHAASAQAHREEAARHGSIAERLGQSVESLACFLNDRQATCREGRLQEYKRRCEARTEEMGKTLGIIQQAFTSVVAAIEETRRDAANVEREELRERFAAEEADELKRQFVHFRDFHLAASASFRESVALELRFATWLREAHKAMQGEVARRAVSLQGHFADGCARALALGRAAVEQVRAQRAQLERALEFTVKEQAACQQALAVLEFSRPSDEQVRGRLRQFEQVQETMRWQEGELEALSAVEARIADGVADLLSGAGEPGLEDGGAWTRRMSEAAAWVSTFFYTRWEGECPAVQASLPPQDSEPAPEPVGGARAAQEEDDAPRGAQEQPTPQSLDLPLAPRQPARGGAREQPTPRALDLSPPRRDSASPRSHGAASPGAARGAAWAVAAAAAAAAQTPRSGASSGGSSSTRRAASPRCLAAGRTPRRPGAAGRRGSPGGGGAGGAGRAAAAGPGAAQAPPRGQLEPAGRASSGSTPDGGSIDLNGDFGEHVGLPSGALDATAPLGASRVGLAARKSPLRGAMDVVAADAPASPESPRLLQAPWYRPTPPRQQPSPCSTPYSPDGVAAAPVQRFRSAPALHGLAAVVAPPGADSPPEMRLSLLPGGAAQLAAAQCGGAVRLGAAAMAGGGLAGGAVAGSSAASSAAGAAPAGGAAPRPLVVRAASCLAPSWVVAGGQRAPTPPAGRGQPWQVERGLFARGQYGASVWVPAAADGRGPALRRGAEAFPAQHFAAPAGDLGAACTGVAAGDARLLVQGGSAAAAGALLDQLDANKDGHLSRAEFAAWTPQAMPAQPGPRLPRAASLPPGARGAEALAFFGVPMSPGRPLPMHAAPPAGPLMAGVPPVRAGGAIVAPARPGRRLGGAAAPPCSAPSGQ